MLQKKCRLNKLKEVEDLKKNNKTLEDQNTDLLKKKSLLEDRVKQLLEFIQDHIAKGCRLTPEQGEVFSKNCKEFGDTMVLKHVNPESFHPRTVQVSSSPEPNVSSFHPAQAYPSQAVLTSVNSSQSTSSGSPITLFTGQPVAFEQMPRSSIRRSSCHSLRSPRSPGSAVYYQQATLTDASLHSNGTSGPSGFVKLPQTGPSQGVSYRQDVTELDRQTSSDSSSSSIPLVVHALEEEDMGNTDERLGQHNCEHISEDIHQTNNEQNMEVVTIPRFESSLSESVLRNTSIDPKTNNLGSGGFAIQQGFVGSDLGQDVPNYSKHPTGRKADDLTQLNVTAPELIAQVILNIPNSEMSSSLKQQIHSNYNSSSQSLPSQGCGENNAMEEEEEQALVEQGQLHQQTIHHDTYSQVNASGFACPQQVTEIYVNNHSHSAVQESSNSPGPSQESSQSNAEFTSPIFKNVRYVEKRGHRFLLDELPNGKYRVYELKDSNTLLDTAFEVTLKDSPAASTSEPPMEETPSPAQLVPEHNENGMNNQFQQPVVHIVPDTTQYQEIHDPPNSSTLQYHQGSNSASKFVIENDTTYAVSSSHFQQEVENETSTSHLQQGPRDFQFEQEDNPAHSSQFYHVSESTTNSSLPQALISASQETVDSSSAGSGLPSINLPSLTFNDFTQEDLDVFSKKPKKSKE